MKESNTGLQGDVALDLMSDERDALQKSRYQMRWDRKRKRFVTAEALANSNKQKGFKNESGVFVTSKGQKDMYPFDQADPSPVLFASKAMEAICYSPRSLSLSLLHHTTHNPSRCQVFVLNCMTTAIKCGPRRTTHTSLL